VPKLLITICARGGSKGIPQKNIKLLNGKPLIYYSIKHAQAFKIWYEDLFKDAVSIALSTDSDAIKDVASECGLKTTYNRPVNLASDTAGKLYAIKDVLNFTEEKERLQYDLILDLDVSAPMRVLDDLKKALDYFIKNPEAQTIYSVNKAHKNPYFNMVERNKEGFYELSKKSGAVLSRQSAPEVYEMNASFYIYRRRFFDKPSLYLFSNSLIFEMQHTCFDLDKPIDFEFLEFLLKHNKLSFKI